MSQSTHPPGLPEARRPLDELLREQCPALDRVRITPQHTRDLAGQHMDWHHVELLDAQDRQIVGAAHVRRAGRREVLALLREHFTTAAWHCALVYTLGRDGRPGELAPQVIVMGCPVASCGDEIGVPSTALRPTDGCPAGVCPNVRQAPEPAKTMTVRVIWRDGWRMAIRTVTVPAVCPHCGGPRGVPQNHNFHEDGEWFSCDRWTNPCGHVDMYAAVLAEAAEFAQSQAPTTTNTPQGDAR